jgi:hypothetical protein
LVTWLSAAARKHLLDPEAHMRNYRRIASAGAAVALTLAGGLAMPASASATALSAQVRCGSGAKHAFDCDLTVSGGTLPYTTTWSSDSGAPFTYTDTYHALGTCTYNSHTVQVSVTDSTGQNVIVYSFFRCTYDV